MISRYFERRKVMSAGELNCVLAWRPISEARVVRRRVLKTWTAYAARRIYEDECQPVCAWTTLLSGSPHEIHCIMASLS